MESKSSVTTAVITLVIGLLVGGGVGYAVSSMNMDDSSDSNMTSMSEDKPSTATKAADLRVTLNQIMRQHVELATVALKDSASGSPDAKAAVAALDNNSVELSKAVGSVYGDDAEKSFLALWRKHIGFFVDYTNAVVKGDDKAKQEAKDNLEGYTTDASKFFANANPNIDQAEFKKGLEKHASQVEAIVDAYAAKKYDKVYDLEEEAYNHIGMAADTLAAAIVKQKPDMF